jgi:hypothetical protein
MVLGFIKYGNSGEFYNEVGFSFWVQKAVVCSLPGLDAFEIEFAPVANY